MLKEKGGVSWTGERFLVSQGMYRVAVLIGNAEVIKLSKVSNTSTSLVRRDTSFVDMMKGLVNYAFVFDLEHGIKFWMQAQRILVTTPTRLSSSY